MQDSLISADFAEGGARRGGARGRQGGDPGRNPPRGTRGARSAAPSQRLGLGRGGRGVAPSWFYSIVSIGLNDRQRALDALDNAFNDHEPCLVSLKVDPVFDPLRQEGRFLDMVRRIGLEP